MISCYITMKPNKLAVPVSPIVVQRSTKYLLHKGVDRPIVVTSSMFSTTVFNVEGKVVIFEDPYIQQYHTYTNKLCFYGC